MWTVQSFHVNENDKVSLSYLVLNESVSETPGQINSEQFTHFTA
jgi:hypothetical protein